MMEPLSQKLQQLNEFAARYEYKKVFDLFFDEAMLTYENETMAADTL